MKTDMKKTNLDYLNDQLKYTGFGEWLNSQLASKVAEGKDQFTLQHKASYGKDDVVATLNFNKSEKTGNYWFNSYDMHLTNPDTKTDLQQRFFINQSNNITFKEGYNLLAGRAVHKTFSLKPDPQNKEQKDGPTTYDSWVQMDFNNTDKHGNYLMQKFGESYGFDLAQTLDSHPTKIKELENPTYRDNIIDSLKKGNLQQVTFVGHDNVEEKKFINASPQFKNIEVTELPEQKVQSKVDQKQNTEDLKASAKETNKIDKDQSKQRQATAHTTKRQSRAKGRGIA